MSVTLDSLILRPGDSLSIYCGSGKDKIARGIYIACRKDDRRGEYLIVQGLNDSTGGLDAPTIRVEEKAFVHLNGTIYQPVRV